MSKAARSIVVFGGYLAILGTGLVVAPALVLRPLGFAAPLDLWVHVLGVVTVVLGAYYVEAARTGLVPFFRATVPVRAAVFVVFGVFVAMGKAPLALGLVGTVDLLGAAWTWMGLRGSAA